MVPSETAAMAWQVNAAEVIDRLDLVPHPEGGHYREIIDPGNISNDDGDPITSTFYLLQEGDFCPLHRVRAPESWYLSLGGPVEFHLIDQHGQYDRRILARNFGGGNLPQTSVPVHMLEGIRPAPGVAWVLLVCTILGTRDFAEIEPVRRQELLLYYPRHTEIVESLTREA